MNLVHFSGLVDWRDIQSSDECAAGLAGAAHQHLRPTAGHHLHAPRFEPWHLVGKGVQFDAGKARLHIGQQGATDT
ncbi:hypothetical protein D3C81_620400 [compost metagenome]